ncbi:MAG: adenylate/guanylate cyclase domain-containing protein [Candidatus Dormiibacterota bacterium]
MPDPLESTAAGTVTLLLSDVEGSTRMWERSPMAMQQALARHDQIVAGTVEEHGGTLVKTRGEGDSTFSVFTDANEAVAAALDLQRRMHEEDWPSQATIRIRVAVHTGQAERRTDDYYGPTVNRCARIRAAAHGGQLVLSRSTYDLVSSTLPEEASTHDLGRHRLKDLAVPEQIFQICHPGIPDDFPPLRTLDYANGNLPLQLTSFVGRQSELDELKSLMADARLVTLVGSGGAGKSRLSVQLARELMDDFSEGVWLVELAPISDASLVTQAVAQVLGLRDELPPMAAGTTSAIDALSIRRLIDHLGKSQMLFVLDNCEHLIAPSAQLCAGILGACPGITILATSREPLGVPGEVVWRVPPMSAPALDNDLSLEELARYEAIRLFVDRAKLNNRDFELVAGDAPAVVEICNRLDGMPLAIELAAARVASLTPSQIAERLRTQFRILSGGARTLPTRQQTLQAAIDWSYELLTEQEQMLFRRLSVFVSGFTVEAAEQVCADEALEDWEVLDVLSRLVDKSLVVPPTMDAHSRYRMLETIRQFGAEELHKSGEEPPTRQRHCDFFLELATTAEPELTRPDQAQWMDDLEREHDNLRAALDYSATAEDATLGLRLVGALWRFWYVRGYISEGRRWAAQALASEAEPHSTMRALAMSAAGRLADADHDTAAARPLLQEAVVMAQDLGDESTTWLAVAYLAQVLAENGELAEARDLGDQGLEIARKLDDPRRVALSLISTGRMAFYRCDYEEARQRLHEGLALAQELRDRRNVFVALHVLGDMATDLGELGAAAKLLDQCGEAAEGVASGTTIAIQLASLARTRILADEFQDAEALLRQAEEAVKPTGGLVPTEVLEAGARLAARQGDNDSCTSLAQDALRRLLRSGERRRMPRLLGLLASSAAAQGQLERAATLFGAAEAHRLTMGSCLAPMERPRYETGLEMTRDGLDAAAFEAAFARGGKMSLEDLVAEAAPTGA